MDKTEYQAEKYAIRKRLLKYTRQAFAMLPPLENPRVLDIGCGPGIPTLELARLCDGEITGIDIDKEALKELGSKANDAGLSGRVKVMRCSIEEMKFPDSSFDIVWAEGSIFVVGFERALKEWKRLLKPGGFMVVHDEEGELEEKLKLIPACGYELLGYIVLDKDTWWQEYYLPIRELTEKTLSTYGDIEEVRQMVESGQREIEWFDENPGHNSSVIFVMRLND